MSGIKNLKEKSKMQLDEMFDAKPAGKPETQKNDKEEIQQTTNLDNQPTKKPEVHPAVKISNKPEIHPAVKISNKPEIQLHGNLDNHLDDQMSRHTPIFPVKQTQTKKMPTYKMTFNLSEDIYKAFNDLYANRILQGRKTEKSEMICEAIEWLIKNDSSFS